MPAWLFRPGYILTAGFGLPTIATALVRPYSTLLWSEATPESEAALHGRARLRVRRWLVTRCRACVAVGEASRSYLESLGATRVLALPNVTSHPTHPPAPLSPPTDVLVLAHVGDWSRHKGSDLATQVFEICAARLGAARVRLLIATNVVTDPVPEGAIVLGYLPHAELWSTLLHEGTRFLLLLSREERWGFVVPEAMSVGVVPVVSNHVGAAADLLAEVQPALTMETAREAAERILAVYRSPSTFQELSRQVAQVESTRTSAWAVETFRRGLAELSSEAPPLTRVSDANSHPS